MVPQLKILFKSELYNNCLIILSRIDMYIYDIKMLVMQL